MLVAGAGAEGRRDLPSDPLVGQKRIEVLTCSKPLSGCPARHSRKPLKGCTATTVVHLSGLGGCSSMQLAAVWREPLTSLSTMQWHSAYRWWHFPRSGTSTSVKARAATVYQLLMQSACHFAGQQRAHSAARDCDVAHSLMLTGMYTLHVELLAMWLRAHRLVQDDLYSWRSVRALQALGAHASCEYHCITDTHV